MITLVDDAGVLPDLPLTNANGVWVDKWDPGFPDIREVSEVYADASGVRDSTQFHGASVAALSLVKVATVAESRREFMDRFAAYCRPDQRSYIHWQLNDEDDSRCVYVRCQSLSRPVEKWNRLYVGAQFVVPRGLIESSLVQVATILPSSGAAESGRSYDLSFDRTYPASDPIGVTSVVNEGNMTAWPVLRVVGPVTNPRILNDTTGKEYEFSGLTLTAGQFLDIDTVNRTMKDQGGSSRMSTLVLSASEWWGLEPGNNDLYFEPDTFTAGTSKLEVSWRHAWL